MSEAFSGSEFAFIFLDPYVKHQFRGEGSIEVASFHTTFVDGGRGNVRRSVIAFVNAIKEVRDHILAVESVLELRWSVGSGISQWETRLVRVKTDLGSIFQVDNHCLDLLLRARTSHADLLSCFFQCARSGSEESHAGSLRGKVLRNGCLEVPLYSNKECSLIIILAILSIYAVAITLTLPLKSPTFCILSTLYVDLTSSG